MRRSRFIKENKMKKITLLLIVTVLSLFGNMASAQTRSADIKFNVTRYNFGKFPENHPIVSCNFVFTNTGDAPLVIHQAIPSCGCTVPNYPTQPIMPGKQGVIKVTYNGTGHSLGAFYKYVTLNTNAKTEMVRLYIQGEMTGKKSD